MPERLEKYSGKLTTMGRVVRRLIAAGKKVLSCNCCVYPLEAHPGINIYFRGLIFTRVLFFAAAKHRRTYCDGWHSRGLPSAGVFYRLSAILSA